MRNSETNKHDEEQAATALTTASEWFADGAVIELVAGVSPLEQPRLMLWKAGRREVARRVQHGGRTYEAPELDSTLSRAMRLPASCKAYSSPRKLFSDLRGLAQHHLGIAESDAGLVAAFAISTWLADCFPSAPVIWIFSSDEELGINLLRLLGCACRRPLLLAEVTASSIRSLPMDLSPTLLLDQQVVRPNFERLVRASSHRGVHLPGRAGMVLDSFGPKAIFCGDAPADILSIGGMRLFLAPSQSRTSTLVEDVQHEIAEEFQPRLLQYRFANRNKVRKCKPDAIQFSSFSFATRSLARSLAACFPEDATLASELVQLLRPQDEEVREAFLLDVKSAILEILWPMVHEAPRRSLRVFELTQQVNALLRSRGEIREYKPEEIGWQLRTMQIARHSASSGQHIEFKRQTSVIVHRLVQNYSLKVSQPSNQACPDCGHTQMAVSA